jgi:hypothetical protein
MSTGSVNSSLGGGEQDGPDKPADVVVADPVDVVVGRAVLQLPGSACDATDKFHRFKRKSQRFKLHGGDNLSNFAHFSSFSSRAGRLANWEFGHARTQLNPNLVKCYKCLYHGHQQRQCALTWCNRCATWGHTVTNCDSSDPVAGGNRRAVVQDERRLIHAARATSQWQRRPPSGAPP